MAVLGFVAAHGVVLTVVVAVEFARGVNGKSGVNARGVQHDARASSTFHKSPHSAKLVTQPAPTTRWSSTRTSMIRSAETSDCVSNSSARDGAATPEGC
jgi:hypothetical protein